MALLPIEAGRVFPVATFYKVSEQIGSGRYSEVYKALDTYHQADVALKLYVGTDPKTHELAKHEAAVLSKLGKINSECFPKLRLTAKHRMHNQYHPLLVLEYGAYTRSDGQKRVVSLKQVIPQSVAAIAKAEPDPDFWAAESLVRWIIQMAQAVKQLHAAGVVHRDLKPANILIKRGPGQSAAVPFFLDFNSAAASMGSDPRSGTRQYLPPEVISGRRQEPGPEDDLWAIAMVGWEMIHGQGSSPQGSYSPHSLVTGAIPEELIAVLHRSLCLNPEDRFADAAELAAALETAAVAPAHGDIAPVLTASEFAHARAAMNRMQRAIGESTCPPGENFIPKEIRDKVTTIIASLSQQETQSLNLVDEIVGLGPIALPVCLEQGYKLQRDGESYRELLAAIAKLGSQEPRLSHRSIDAYALSSNYGVRAHCWATCEALGYFPERLLDSLSGDEGVLLPEERIKVADLCIRFSDDATAGTDAGDAVLALIKYLCREYILDPRRYRALCRTVARRMNELRFRRTAALIVEATQTRIWAELNEFNIVLPPAIEGGLVELLAEAFAATGAEGFKVLKSGKIPRAADVKSLPIFRKFAIKLARRNDEARAWLTKEAAQHYEDWELQSVVKKLGNQESTRRESPETLFDEYLRSGGRLNFNRLRFWQTHEILGLVKARILGDCPGPMLSLILKLLNGYETRHRMTVVEIVEDKWDKLRGHDYDAAVAVMTDYFVPEVLWQRAVDLLNQDLNGPHSAVARRGLERLLR